MFSIFIEFFIDSFGNCVGLLGSIEIFKMDKFVIKVVIKVLFGSGDRFMCWMMVEKFMVRYLVV